MLPSHLRAAHQHAADQWLALDIMFRDPFQDPMLKYGSTGYANVGCNLPTARAGLIAGGILPHTLIIAELE